ncbi:uncharacterized protein ColSpa_10875 [Colletotrichum spaethianum]|uniref:Uncharacterized protein n=1 Tax=Colletotrichum spaethianum TaxID=700344 RepID=A0AA37PEF4_9PEZI|nr:uncharacterized protein ColSpa_10875 [Colletotrichum spaethianum]GKT50694.1 hypothetical protein ColSpa_10875 [Colletotrichum spaethianum]
MGEKFIVEFGSSKVCSSICIHPPAVAVPRWSDVDLTMTLQDEDREALINKLTADERTKVVKRFDHAIFSGVVIETGNHNMDTLRAIPNVGNVWPSRNEGMLGALGGSQS